jgi:uncharacterized protein (TIGR03083 family)
MLGMRVNNAAIARTIGGEHSPLLERSVQATNTSPLFRHREGRSVTAPITQLDALRTSAGRLRGIVASLDNDAIVKSAYPTDWTIAQVMSHLGSGAVILQRRLEDVLAGTTTPEEFAPQIWDEWNAKGPRAQVDDGLAADAALLAALEALSADQRDAFAFAMGPMSFDFDGFVGLRLNEHAFHTWDIDVALDHAAALPVPIAAFVVDNLELVGRYTAQPTAGDPATITVRTTDPDRRFTVEFTADGATLTPSAATGAGDVELPAEAFARLVYGRLDPAHAPPFVGDPTVIDRIRATYPGP